MTNKNRSHWLQSIKHSINSFIEDSKKNNPFEIIDVLTCDNTGNKLAVIKLQGHYTKTMSIKDIVFNDHIINGLSQQAVRALTYLHAIEQLAPEFTLENIQLNNITEDYIVTLRSRFKNTSNLQQSAVNISKDNNIITKLNSKDANKIGYMAGVKDTIDEFALRNKVEPHGKI